MVKKRKKEKQKHNTPHTLHPSIHILGYIFSSSAFQKCVTAKIKISAPNISFIPPMLSVVSLLLYLFFKYRQHNWDLTSSCDSQSGLPEIGISHLSRQKNQTALLHQTCLGTSKFKLYSVPTEAEVVFICFPNTLTGLGRFKKKTKKLQIQWDFTIQQVI